MRFATNGDLSFLGWLFTFSGIFTVIIIALIIWLIFSFIQKNKNNNQNKQNQNHFPQKEQYKNDSKYNDEFSDEKSFWDDFNKNEDFPQRVEEPIPPNAVPPSPTPTYAQESNGDISAPVDCEVKLRSDGLYEKDCYKEITKEDMLADVQIQNNPPQNNNE